MKLAYVMTPNPGLSRGFQAEPGRYTTNFNCNALAGMSEASSFPDCQVLQTPHMELQENL
jgi:hypothetical protein